MTDTDQIKCPNCENLLYGQFCFSCGQNQKGVDRFFWSIINEAMGNIFSRDSKILLTIFYLFARPGFLALEYFNGKRARYIQPVRIYIFSSLIFFSILSLSNYFSDDIQVAPSVNADGQTNFIIGSKEEFDPTGPDSGMDKEFNFVQIDLLDDETNNELRERLKKKTAEFYEDRAKTSKSILSGIIESAPAGLIVILPIFALFMKLFYFTSGFYYTRHLVLTVYNHSFLFLAFSANLLLGFLDQWITEVISYISTLIEVWIVIYIFMSLKIFYNQGYTITIFKFFFLGLIYFIMFVFIYLIIFLWNVLV